MLPPDWQRRMIDMIRGATELDGTWFAGGPALSPVQQIGVYRTQYGLRLTDALRVEVPGLVRLLGDDLEPLLRAFLADHPSTSYTLNDIAVPLADWLERRGAPEAQVDMARLDRAVMAGFEAAEPVPLQADQLTATVPLVHAPPVTCLRLRTDVHRVRADAIAGRSGQGPTAVDVPLVVFRRGIRMRHLALDDLPWRLLCLFEQPTTLQEALGRLIADGADADRVAAGVGGWFRDFATQGLLQPAAIP